MSNPYVEALLGKYNPDAYKQMVEDQGLEQQKNYYAQMFGVQPGQMIDLSKVDPNSNRFNELMRINQAISGSKSMMEQFQQSQQQHQGDVFAMKDLTSDGKDLAFISGGRENMTPESLLRYNEHMKRLGAPRVNTTLMMPGNENRIMPKDTWLDFEGLDGNALPRPPTEGEVAAGVMIVDGKPFPFRLKNQSTNDQRKLGGNAALMNMALAQYDLLGLGYTPAESDPGNVEYYKRAIGEATGGNQFMATVTAPFVGGRGAMAANTQNLFSGPYVYSISGTAVRDDERNLANNMIWDKPYEPETMKAAKRARRAVIVKSMQMQSRGIIPDSGLIFDDVKTGNIEVARIRLKGTDFRMAMTPSGNFILVSPEGSTKEYPTGEALRLLDIATKEALAERGK